MRYLSIVAIAAGLMAASPAIWAQDTQKGYEQAVTDPNIIATVTTRFEQDFKTLGISAKVESCRFMAQVAVGSRDSDTAYGAACDVTFNTEKPKLLLLCDDAFGESFAMLRAGFVNSPDWMAGFVRKNCF
jgi:hypothetical protein